MGNPPAARAARWPGTSKAELQLATDRGLRIAVLEAGHRVVNELAVYELHAIVLAECIER